MNVMTNLVKNMMSVLLFEASLIPETISADFNYQQSAGLSEFPEWSTKATRRKLIHKYWSTIVFRHFITLITLPVLIIFFSAGVAGLPTRLFSILSAGLVIYSVLYIFCYRPYFESIFLPRLETIKESFDRKESTRMEICRKSQLSNLSLTLIFYAFDKFCKLNSLQCNEESAKKIARLYGIDSGSVQKCLILILGKSRPLTARKITEIENQFEKTYLYLEGVGFTKGIEILNLLERKLLKRV